MKKIITKNNGLYIFNGTEKVQKFNKLNNVGCAPKGTVIRKFKKRIWDDEKLKILITNKT